MKIVGNRSSRGRPINTGKYKEKTVLIRVPISELGKINKMLEDFLKEIEKIDKKI
jgi:hypothetical protein